MATFELDRRQLLQGLWAGSIVAFIGGCEHNPEIGRSQMLLVSDADLARMGHQTWKNIKEQERVSTDAGLKRRVQTIGQRCVDAANMGHLDWEFAVFENDQINAFALPGGRVGFYSGIFQVMDNDSQVATVMGHEVGHVAARHSAERVSQQIAAGLITTAATVALVGSGNRNAGLIAAALGAGVTFGVILPYSRRQEFEADRLGVRYMADAGFQPQEAVTFWQNMTAKNQRQPLEFMSTHPSDERRIAAIQQQVATLRA